VSTYVVIFRNSFCERLIYRSGVWLQIISGVFFILIQVSLWAALIATGYAEVGLEEMITFVIINFLVINLTRFDAARMLGERVRDGSIALDMLLPVSFKWKLFCELMGGNVFAVFFAGIPGVAIAVIFYGAKGPLSVFYFFLFLCSLILGVLLAFQIQFLFNLSAFWIINPWYIEFLTGGLNRLFGGLLIPLWLYPMWLYTLSMYLPFRFIVFESIQIYLGRVDLRDVGGLILMQFMWLFVLLGLEVFIWYRASKKIFVQGG